jgi:hypothetical protein
MQPRAGVSFHHLRSRRAADPQGEVFSEIVEPTKQQAADRS